MLVLLKNWFRFGLKILWSTGQNFFFFFMTNSWNTKNKLVAKLYHLLQTTQHIHFTILQVKNAYVLCS